MIFAAGLLIAGAILVASGNPFTGCLLLGSAVGVWLGSSS